MIGANNDLVVVSPAVRVRNGESGANIRVKLHEKPFQLLLALLEHPGEVVDRRQLQERLWPDHTFVDFENGLNNAVGPSAKRLGTRRRILGLSKRCRVMVIVSFQKLRLHRRSLGHGGTVAG